MKGLKYAQMRPGLLLLGVRAAVAPVGPYQQDKALGWDPCVLPSPPWVLALDTWEDSGYTGELILGTRTIPGAVRTHRLPSAS